MLSFRIIGIDVRVQPTFFLLLLLLFFTGSGFLAAGFACFSLVHELAHGFMARILGYRPSAITACLFGGVLHLSEPCVLPQDELLIHLAGPLSNLLLASLFYCLDHFFPSYIITAAILSNLLLALFNLLPFFPLDGGKVINIYLSRFLSPERTEALSKLFSNIFLVFLFFFGIYLVQYNLINLLISALAVNLFLAGREDSRYSYKRLKHLYRELEKENRI